MVNTRIQTNITKQIQYVFNISFLIKPKLFPYCSLTVDTGKEGDKRAEKARELYKYLTDNKDGLLPYDKRNLNLPQPPEGVCYKKMGVQENQNCTVITMRMKGKRRHWSISGANNMAKLLYKK